MIYKSFIFLITLQFVTITGCAQSPDKIIFKPASESYGVDHKYKIVVWNYQLNKEKHVSQNEVQVEFKNVGVFTIPSLSYRSPIQQHGYTLYLTAFPIINIRANDSIVDEPKKAAKFTFFDNNDTIQSTIGIELRGNISQTFPKKTYDIEFWEDEKGLNNKDVKFKDLRSDDDWILDGLYNEPLRLRSFIASKLWLSIHKPFYADQRLKAKSGIDLFYIEVFINDSYKGLFTFSEQVDKNLLKLKDPENETIYGALYKASGYEGATMFERLPDFENLFPHWGGYEMEFPVIEYNYYWNDLYEFTDFVLNASPEEFRNNIDKKINLENAIDYYLLMNLLRATDNLGKNYYIAQYDKDTPYFLVPWDLDGVLGTIIDGRHIPTTDDMLSNGLFDRLIKDNPKNYRDRLRIRWQNLRKKEFNGGNILATIDKWYDRFDKEKIYEREELLWKPEISRKEQLKYLKQWLEKRLVFLDNHFKNL